jgi:hypothetical protein
LCDVVELAGRLRCYDLLCWLKEKTCARGLPLRKEAKLKRFIVDFGAHSGVHGQKMALPR